MMKSLAVVIVLIGATSVSAQDRPCRLYDSHAHLVSGDLVRYPRNPMQLDPSELMADGPFVPGTVGQPGGMHGAHPVNEKPTAEQLREWMAQLQVCGMAAVQKGMIYRTDNSYIVDSAERFPDLMRAVAIVDPQAPETTAAIRELARRGTVGIRFFGINVKDKRAWLTSPQALTVWTLADELGLVVDIEGSPQDTAVMIAVVESMADRFPNLRIVLDHVFMPVVTDADFGIGPQFAGLAARRNIYVKFTSLNMDVIREQGIAPEAVLKRTVDVFGADRVMWGSDIGTSSGTYREMVERAVAATAMLDEVQRRKVLHDTGRKVFTGWREAEH